jgi:hypothetical protein
VYPSPPGRLNRSATTADTIGMAKQGISYGRPATGGGGFLGLEPKYVAAVIIAVVLAVAILGAALIMRPKPAPSDPWVDPAEIACLEGGGEWRWPTCYH